MGVMSCSRRGCDSIMCDTHVDSIGYVCPECQNEFKEYVNLNHFPINSIDALRFYLNRFMDTGKGNFTINENKVNIDEFFNYHRR